SRVPSGLTRAAAKLFGLPTTPPSPVKPASTILPSAWRARALAFSTTPSEPKLNVSLPGALPMAPVPAALNVVSRLPSGLRRVTAKSAAPASSNPPTTILPSAWIATPVARSSNPKSTVALPSVSNVVSSPLPSATTRATAKLLAVPPPWSVYPAITILPSAWRASALAKSLPPNVKVNFPSALKAVSRVPSALNCAIAKSDDPPSSNPPTTIRPSGRMATAVAWSSNPKSTVAFPPVPKVPSSVPSGLTRATAKLFGLPTTPPSPVNPATTILPSGWIATALACSTTPSEPKLNVSLPGALPMAPVPAALNVVSRLPSGLRRVTAKSAAPASSNPTTTILPSAWTATALAWSLNPKSTVCFPPVPNDGSSPPTTAGTSRPSRANRFGRHQRRNRRVMASSTGGVRGRAPRGEKALPDR